MVMRRRHHAFVRIDKKMRVRSNKLISVARQHHVAERVRDVPIYVVMDRLSLYDSGGATQLGAAL
jgi:hypothetical protein